MPHHKLTSADEDPRTMQQRGLLTPDPHEYEYHAMRRAGILIVSETDQAWLWELAHVVWPCEQPGRRAL